MATDSPVEVKSTPSKKQRFKTLFNVVLDGKTIDAGAEVALNEDQWRDLKAMGAIEGDWSN